VGAEAGKERFERRGGAFNFDCDSIRVVADEAGESLFKREAVDERAEADALHDTAHTYFVAFSFRLGFVGQFRPRTGVQHSAWATYVAACIYDALNSIPGTEQPIDCSAIQIKSGAKAQAGARALSAGVFTVAMDVCGLPPFAQRTHKGWGTRSCVNTQLENAVDKPTCPA